MNSLQISQIESQLPEMTRILRTYRAFEGDIRVIVKLPDNQFETRYTVKFEDNYPRIELMP
jgi:hypothetical protein